ncbi:hypothetical protein G6F57_012698 [Rhizopus arrhizus]|nr:hypothetical protein G6F23_009541 [Rhizopus arrhizus]KAG1406220.1 hypothetical protein G6F58_009873 [Rhizopus delemar]KAG0755136.1 hypothetical protein G6F24_012037 [Rhizopus arrhizus]KAG0781318.1 hypothetical protein G6F21_011705 [Rhizopus arrhizus]KAG0805479.1 hypothetical protein G6F20_011869 [Rhizopus arrhizus]
MEKESLQLSSCQQWKVAFIHAFASTFNPQQTIAPSFFKLPEFTPNQLEAEIQKEDSELVHNIICSCLGNIFNRKNPIESYTKSLQDVVSEKMKTLDIELDKNPLRDQKFNTLSVDLKLLLLYSMIEWQLQDSQAVRYIIDYCNTTTRKNQRNPIRSSPIGADKQKNTYWQFGESSCLWKETANKKNWEKVCKDKQELEAFVDQISSSTNRAEKALSKYIIEHVYPLAEKEERKKAKLEREEWKRLNPIEPVETRTYTRKRERVNYNYDNFYETDDSDEYLESSSSPPPLKKPTRSSSRLNNIE